MPKTAAKKMTKAEEKELTKAEKKELLLDNQIKDTLRDMAKLLSISFKKDDKTRSLIAKISPKLTKTSMKRICTKDPELADLILKNFILDERLHSAKDETQTQKKSVDDKNKARLAVILKTYF